MSHRHHPKHAPPQSQSKSAVPKGGYLPMAARPDADSYAPSSAVASMQLPKKVDLRPFMTPVEDQGDTSSCVANAVAGAYEYALKRATQQDHDVSRLYVYYNARWRNEDQDKDEGSVIQYAMEGLQKFGACPETTWPFQKALLLKKPNQVSYKQGAEGRVRDMRQVPIELEAWKQCLAEGLPIVFGCVLFDSFDQCNQRGGVVPMPSPEDLHRAEHGGHSMCCVGYSDVEGVFIVRNSWGDSWGDQGYCYMPYNYLMNPKFNDGDCWVFTPPHDLAPATEAWVEDEKPVTNGGEGVDFEINQYDISQYVSVAVNLFHAIGGLEWNATVSQDFHKYVTSVSEEAFHLLEHFDVDECVAEFSTLLGFGGSPVATQQSLDPAETAIDSEQSSEMSQAESYQESAVSEETDQSESNDQSDQSEETEEPTDSEESGDSGEAEDDENPQ